MPKLTDFSGGLNTIQPADNIADNQFSTLTNVTYDEGTLRSRYGFSRTSSATNIRKIYPFYVSGSLHLIYTTTSGLYDNGTLLDATFTGTFIASEWAEMLYLTNGTYFKRYDGTTLYNVGMEAPDAPTITASAYDKIVTDAFDTNPTDYSMWAAPYDGGGSGTVAFENGAGNYIEGAGSVKVVVPNGEAVRIYRNFGSDQDWSAFSGGASSDSDYFTVWIKINNPDYVDGMQILIDIDSSTTWPTPTTNYYKTPYNKIAPAKTYESKFVGDIINTLRNWAIDQYGLQTQETMGIEYLPAAANEFVLVKIPKKDFERVGSNTTKGWDTVRGLSFIFWANSNIPTGTDLEIYLDDGGILGAEGAEDGLTGNWYFCSGYYNSSRDEYYEVSEEVGPVTLATNNVDYSGVPATFPDAQADRYLIWAREESGSSWYRLVSIEEGTTSDTVNMGLSTLLAQPELTEQADIYPLPKYNQARQLRTRDTSNNSVPPVGSFIIMHRGKLFILDEDRIYHSKTGQPWAVPADFWLRAASSSDIFQGAYSDGSTLMVHSKSRDYIYMNAGEYDGAFLYMGYLAAGRRVVGCISPHSITMGFYCSSRGIAVFDGQNARILTERIRPTYRSISSKTSLHMALWEDALVLVEPGGDVIVMEGLEGSVVFYQWSLISTARCCVVDDRTNTLYIGTDTGIYRYNTSSDTDAEGAFTMTAHSRKFEFAPVDSDSPLERWAVELDAGGSSTRVDFEIDGTTHGTGTFTNSSQTEQEGFFDLGAVGSKIQVKLTATISEGPVKLYAVEFS